MLFSTHSALCVSNRVSRQHGDRVDEKRFQGDALVVFKQNLRCMFDERAFQTWPLILVGAVMFSALFTLLALMAELLFEGTLQMTSTVVGFGVASFTGYIGTAAILRKGSKEADE